MTLQWKSHGWSHNAVEYESVYLSRSEILYLCVIIPKVQPNAAVLLVFGGYWVIILVLTFSHTHHG